MKKLFALAIAASLFSGLYGFSIGLGGRYDQIAADSVLGDAYLAIRADVMCKPMPILGFRMGLVEVDLKKDANDESATEMHFGTGVNADILVYIPMMGMINPYLVLGFWYTSEKAHPVYGEYTGWEFHGGLGGEFGFGGFAAYLEGAYIMKSFSPEGADSDSYNWFYVQGGVRVPIGL